MRELLSKVTLEERRKSHEVSLPGMQMNSGVEPTSHIRSSARIRYGGGLSSSICTPSKGSPKAEPAARRWLVRYLSEGTPSVRDVAKVTARLAAHSGGDQGLTR